MNRTSHSDWVKIFGDPNGQIKLHPKQKYDVLSATDSPNDYLEYDIKLSDGEAPDVEIWVMGNTHSLPLFPSPLLS